MKFIKKLFLVLSLFSFFSLGSFSANACTVKVGDFDWDSANIHTAIGSYIMEHGYGCNVEVTKGSTNPILAALIDNQLDIIFEHWTDNNVALIDPELATGNLVDLGINTPASEQAFFVDRATSEAHGITDVSDLKKPGVWELFKDPEDPSRLKCIEVFRPIFSESSFSKSAILGSLNFLLLLFFLYFAVFFSVSLTLKFLLIISFARTLALGTPIRALACPIDSFPSII